MFGGVKVKTRADIERKVADVRTTNCTATNNNNRTLWFYDNNWFYDYRLLLVPVLLF